MEFLLTESHNLVAASTNIQLYTYKQNRLLEKYALQCSTRKYMFYMSVKNGCKTLPDMAAVVVIEGL